MHNDKSVDQVERMGLATHDEMRGHTTTGRRESDEEDAVPEVGWNGGGDRGGSGEMRSES